MEEAKSFEVIKYFACVFVCVRACASQTGSWSGSKTLLLRKLTS